MSVPLSEIRAMGNAVFDAIEASGAASLEPSKASIGASTVGRLWDLSCQPALLTGDLNDDISDIRKDLTEYTETCGKDRMAYIGSFYRRPDGTVLSMTNCATIF